MIGEAFKGDIKDVCAELERELEYYKDITVEEWLHERRMSKALAEKLGITVEELRYGK